jgi:hypothetical protein
MQPPVQRTIANAAIVAVFFGMGTTFVAIRLLGAMWNSCEVGINSGANLISMVVVGSPTSCVAGLLCGVVFGVVAFRAPTALAYVATALVAILFVWAVLAWQHNPGGDYPEMVCENNIPPWWPDFIPL